MLGIPACAECGSNPTNHWFAWTTTSLDVALERAGLSGRLSDSFSTVLRVGSTWFGFIPRVFDRVARALHIITPSHDVGQAYTRRSRVVWEEAQRRGIPMHQLKMFGLPGELYEAEVGGEWQVFRSLPIPSKYRTNALWPDDKYALKKVFVQQGIKVPAYESVSTLDEAKQALARMGTVCIKPRIGSNGRHTFPYVTDEKDLREAFYSAKKLCHWIVVEQYIDGNIGRATCVDGKLVGYLESQYPTVIGDGTHTVRELIDKANAEKPERVEDIEVTSVHEKYIGRRGYSLDSVLEAGKALPLIYWGGYGSGGRSTEFGTNIHPALKEEIERAAKITTLPVVGFDLIIKNPTEDPATQEWGIIEANSLPWIDLHSYPLYGEPQNVAKAVWDLWDK